jgi:hypothetical protein
MRKLVFTLIAAAAAAEVWAIQGTINTETDSRTGDIKWQARNKQYVVSIKKGQTVVDMELKLEDVMSLDIPKPAGFDKAVSMVDSGQGSSAIPVLTKIVTDYRMLQWDKPAARYLVMAYLAADNADKAYRTATAIISEDKSAAYTGDLAAAYWQTLLKLGKKDVLKSMLKKAASSGDRASSAAALVMRGDVIVSGCNDAPEGLKQALRDGYLRVVLMYTDAACKRERAEAMLKAAACFDKLGQAARAEKLRAGAKSI